MCVYYMYYCFHAILQIGSFPCYVCQRAFFHHVPPVWLWGPKRILWSRLSALQMRTSWVWIEIESRTQENLMIVSVRMKTKYSNSLLSVLGLANSEPWPIPQHSLTLRLAETHRNCQLQRNKKRCTRAVKLWSWHMCNDGPSSLGHHTYRIYIYIQNIYYIYTHKYSIQT